mgnify:CR=1 FL=1|jgi:hypothetical protein
MTLLSEYAFSLISTDLVPLNVEFTEISVNIKSLTEKSESVYEFTAETEANQNNLVTSITGYIKKNEVFITSTSDFTITPEIKCY